MSDPLGLIFVLVVKQVLKSINPISRKFVLKVIFIYVCASPVEPTALASGHTFRDFSRQPLGLSTVCTRSILDLIGQHPLVVFLFRALRYILTCGPEVLTVWPKKRLSWHSLIYCIPSIFLTWALTYIINKSWTQKRYKPRWNAIISFLTMENWNPTLQYFLGARGLLHSTLPREYTD